VQRNFFFHLIFILVVQVLINTLCNYLFPTNALVAMITSDALIALFFAYIIIPPEFRKGFYKQEFFHKTAITYFLIFSLISVLFGVII